MSVYMEPLIDELIKAWEEGCGRTTERQRQTSECMSGTTTLCMTSQRMAYFVTGVLTESYHAQHARQLCSSFG